MRIEWIAAIILLIFCQCGRKVSAENVPTPGETVVVESPVNESGTLRHRIECFPGEVYFGDTVYVASYIENVSEERSVIVPVCGRLDSFEGGAWTFNFSADHCNNVYSFHKEFPERHIPRKTYGASNLRVLFPGEKQFVKLDSLDLPPLEDLEDPFWKEFREDVSAEGRLLHVTVLETYSFELDGEEIIKESTERFDIVVKPRTRPETDLLERWYKGTPQEMFPIVSEGFKVPSDREQKSEGRSDIEILGEKFDPWALIRFGNRKPSAPNNPTTLDGWRELESSLTPSTMRDEVRLTRLRLEYYAAKDEGDARAAKKAYCDWIESLPEVQRLIMTRYDYCGAKNVKEQRFNDKSLKLRNWNYQLGARLF